MKILAPFFAFNILIVPLLLIVHFQGTCRMLDPYLAQYFPSYCQYVENVFMNILYANAVILFVILFMTGHQSGGGHSSSSSKSSKPSGGGGHH